MNEKFADLGLPRRVWAVAAVHGDLERLATLHDHMATRFAVGDRMVYLGNYLGVGARDNDAVIDELLAFRSALLAKPGMEPADIVHLRGTAEEAWQRLLRLQFAPVPAQMLDILLDAGVEPWLRLYGVSLGDIKTLARADSVTITRWTNQLRVAQRLSPGHEPLTFSMKRAAVAGKGPDSALTLFVPAGFDPSRALEDQGDCLWFGEEAFRLNLDANIPFARIVRGFDPARGGVVSEGRAITLDGGCGFGGPLVCGGFDARGKLMEIIAVGGHGDVESYTRESRERPAARERRAAHAPAHAEDPRAALSA